MLVVFWAGIPVEVTQGAGVVPRCRRAAIGTPISLPHTTHKDTVDVFYTLPTGGNHIIWKLTQNTEPHKIKIKL